MLKCVRVFIVVKIDFKATILQIEFFCTSLQTHTHTPKEPHLHLAWELSWGLVQRPLITRQTFSRHSAGVYQSLLCSLIALWLSATTLWCALCGSFCGAFANFLFSLFFFFAAVVSVTLADAGDGKLSTLVWFATLLLIYIYSVLEECRCSATPPLPPAPGSHHHCRQWSQSAQPAQQLTLCFGLAKGFKCDHRRMQWIDNSSSSS